MHREIRERILKLIDEQVPAIETAGLNTASVPSSYFNLITESDFREGTVVSTEEIKAINKFFSFRPEAILDSLHRMYVLAELNQFGQEFQEEIENILSPELVIYSSLPKNISQLKSPELRLEGMDLLLGWYESLPKSLQGSRKNDLIMKRAEAKADLGRYAEAVEDFEELLKNLDCILVRDRLKALRLKHNDYDGAIRDIDRSWDMVVSSGWAFVERIERRLAEGNLEGAKEDFAVLLDENRAIDKEPYKERILKSLILLHVRSGSYDDAFEQVVKLGRLLSISENRVRRGWSNSPTAVEWYVDLLRHEGKEDQVEPFLEQATVSFASDVPKRLLVEQYLAKGNLHGALALCEKICCFLDSDAPKDDRLEYYKLGAQICAQMQDDQKAFYWYRNRSYLLREDQLLLSQVEAPLDAIKRCLMRAIEERDFVTISLYNELNDNELNECISKDISFLMKLGAAYSKSSRHADSIKVFNDVLRIDPSQPEALRSLAYTHNLCGRFGESEKFYTEYLKYRPHDPSALFSRGSVRLSLGWRSIPGALIDFFSAIRFRNTSKSV